MISRTAWEQFQLKMKLEPGAALEPYRRINVLGPMDDDLESALREKFNIPFTMDWSYDPRSVLIRLQLPDGVLDVRRRASAWRPARSSCSSAGWSALRCCCSASPRCSCATRCARSAGWRVQRRPSAPGGDVPPIRPEGASEVRQAATAFNRMQERIRRFLLQRTEMLAGVSHDLRTPLTRLRLALAMLPRDAELEQDVAEMTADVEEMDRMIAGYLAFARGEGTEQAEPVNLALLLDDIAAGARRAGMQLDLNVPAELTLKLAGRCGEPGDHQPGRQCPPPCPPRHARRGGAGPLGAGHCR